jgi:hypothetical protein
VYGVQRFKTFVEGYIGVCRVRRVGVSLSVTVGVGDIGRLIGVV